jgi:hypothetical protein
MPALIASPAPEPAPAGGRAGATADPGASALDGCLESLELACLGAGLPAAAEHELQQASRCYADPMAVERHLLRAVDLAPQHPATLIGLYRFYFYRNRLVEALQVGERCLANAARVNGLPAAWQMVRPEQADFGGFSAVPRLYLFSLQACAYLCLRLGALERGGALLDKLVELDPGDRVHGSVLRGVLQRWGQDDDE